MEYVTGGDFVTLLENQPHGYLSESKARFVDLWSLANLQDRTPKPLDGFFVCRIKKVGVMDLL
jgi:hypothetical protein